MAENFDEFNDDVKSKSQIKRELLELKELGRELVELPVKELERFDLSEKLYDTIIKAQSLTHGALKREIGFIGALIVHEDWKTIQQELNKLRQVDYVEVKAFHQLEQWRDELLSGDAQVMTVLRNHFDMFDMQHVRQLVRNANKEVSQNKPAKSSRLLFKYLKQCQLEQG